ncbi:MAG: CoF synthetase [Opitutaceae bacterium]
MNAACPPHFANPSPVLGAAVNGYVPAALEGEIRAIYGRSPLYAKRHALEGGRLHWAGYENIPLLTKRDIVEHGHCAFFDDCTEVDAKVQRKEWEYESTSGTTQGPMTVIMERRWWPEQTTRAYAAHPVLAPYASSGARRAILAPVGCSSNLCPYEDFEFPQRFIDNTIYLNLHSDPFVFLESEWDRIVLELQATQPEVLEGEPVYLSLLARAAQKRKVRVPSVQAVILTYGKASREHGRRIAEVFPAPQVDLYGSTEAGYIFVGDAFADNSRPIDANVFIELVPFRALPETFQIVVTTRGREAMPLLRYLTGDIVQRFPTGFRLAGRERDLHFRRDGSLVSPADIDRALPENFACWHYCLSQTGETAWKFDYVAEHSAGAEVADAIAATLGDGARVTMARKRLIAPAASGKFALLKPLGVGAKL